MKRLEALKQCLAEALKDKANNKHYIEDLKVSIEYEEAQVDRLVLHGLVKQ